MASAAKVLKMPLSTHETSDNLSENLAEGYINMFRSIREHWIWKDAEKLKWWLDILMEVNYKPGQMLIGNTVIDCDRGQKIFSLESWSKQWRTSIGSVRRFFALLEKHNMLMVENLNVTTRITVLNYKCYNDKKNTSQAITIPFVDKREQQEPQKPAQLTDSNTGTYEDTRHDGGTAAARLRHDSENAAATIEESKERKEYTTTTDAPAVAPEKVDMVDENISNISDKPASKPKKKEKKVSAYEGFTDDQIILYQSAMAWIAEKAPRVLKMPEPLTIKQYFRLIEEYDAGIIEDCFQSMHNWKPLLTKSVSALLTFYTFAKNRQQKLL